MYECKITQDGRGCSKTVEISDQEIKDLKRIRAYFLEHDESLMEHMAFAVLDRIIKKASR